jgi:cell division septation protein DedD
VQVGVFSSVERANKVASDLRIRCTSLDLECPRIVPRQTADGGTLHVVQIGCFPNRGLANKVLLQFPRSGYRVEAYCEAAASPRGGE